MRTRAICLACLLLACVLLTALPCEPVEFGPVEFGGKIVEQPVYRHARNDSLLNPGGSILDIPEWTNRFYGDFNIGAGGDIRFEAKIRPSTTYDRSGGETKVFVDDAYLDVKHGERYFFYLGRKNIRDGVGFVANPTDFLGEGKAVDYSLREEERRLSREGNYIAGVDAYFTDATLAAIYAPRLPDAREDADRILLKANMMFPRLNSDLSLHFFNGDIPGVGVNLSSTFGEKLVLYTEAATRWGSGRKTVRLVNAGEPNIYELSGDSGSRRAYRFVVLGGHYTFGNGTNIICEYLYNGDGYNRMEWNELADFVKYSHDNYLDNYLPDLMRANLLQANGVFSFRRMRKNYLFARIGNPEIAAKADGAVVLIVNADDRSYIVNPSLDYRYSANASVGITMTTFGGGEKSEFGMMHWNAEAGVILKYVF